MSPRSETEPVRVLLVRHGQTAWNAEGRIQGHTDIALDGTGLRQARRLADALDGEAVDAIYSSDLARALQTAAPLAMRRALPIRPLADLRERAFGALEGRTFPEIEALDPQAALRWRQRDPQWQPPGGESLDDFRHRAVSALRAIASAHGGQTVVVVTHGGTLDILHREALSLSLQAPRTWVLANAAVQRLLVHDGGITIVGWNDASHLAGEGRDEAAA